MILRNLIVLLVILRTVEPFYVPGVAPQVFHQGDNVEVRAVKLTSSRTQLPYDYYHLKFCEPPNGKIQYKGENLGEIIRGDRVVNTAYGVSMADNLDCAVVCSQPLEKNDIKIFRHAVVFEYFVHLSVDNLPSVTRLSIGSMVGDNSQESKLAGRVEPGYRLGIADPEGKRVILNNHLKFKLKYHLEEDKTYRIVGFETEPMSIDWAGMGEKFDGQQCKMPAINDKALILDENDEKREVAFTYSVSWEPSDVKWASRWDAYLEMSDVQIHWFSIINSIVVVFFLTGIIAVIFIRALRRDIAKYNLKEDLEETLEESGWKLVHGDVFRPPRRPILFVSLIGAGVQLVGMTFVAIFFAMLGMLSPSSRGSLMTALIFLFHFMGLFAGYFGGRLYRTLKGQRWKKAAIITGVLYPSMIFAIGIFLNIMTLSESTSSQVSFTTFLALVSLWFGISVPLVFTGYYFGYRKQSYEHPVRTNQIPRQVPEQNWYNNVFISSLLAGILPFGSVFIELFYILTAIWENQYYYLFGFLFVVFIILLISTAQISIVMVYFQLCNEVRIFNCLHFFLIINCVFFFFFSYLQNYHWWWRSFIVSGGPAIYMFAYSLFYFLTKLEITTFVPTILYFGYTMIFCITFFLLTGTVGFYAAYYFVIRIFAAIKID